MPPSTQLVTGDAIPVPGLRGFEILRVIAPGETPIEFNDSWPENWERTLEPGVYRFIWEDVSGNTAEYIAGVNAGDEIESDLRPRQWTLAPEMEAGPDGQSLSQPSPESAQNFGQNRRQLDLLPWLLSAAILILLLEAILAWR